MNAGHQDCGVETPAFRRGRKRRSPPSAFATVEPPPQGMRWQRVEPSCVPEHGDEARTSMRSWHFPWAMPSGRDRPYRDSQAVAVPPRIQIKPAPRGNPRRSRRGGCQEVIGEHAAWRPGRVAAAFMLGAAGEFLIAATKASLPLGRTRQAARTAQAVDAVAEADRMRTALLAAVSHDLRTPLAAAQAAVSCLRSADLPLTAEDHDELLATADESLNQLAHLTASLLDVSRLQAGALPVFPRPADLSEIITRSLEGLAPPVPAVAVHCPPGLPQVMADPPLMERVIVNVTANALRYSPADSPPLLTAGARGDRVELRVIDRGPGIPAAERDRAFLPFQRLGATGSTTGVGLGLTVSRGLTEAMGGTLNPEETPGGGLTMTISLPAVAQATYPAGPGTRSIFTERAWCVPHAGTAADSACRDRRSPPWKASGTSGSRSPAL
jgi:signal transduction histidine kinase